MNTTTEDKEREARGIADRLISTLMDAREVLDKDKPAISFDNSNIDVHLRAVAWVLGLLIVSFDDMGEKALIREKLAATVDQAMAIAPLFRQCFENDPQCVTND